MIYRLKLSFCDDLEDITEQKLNRVFIFLISTRGVLLYFLSEIQHGDNIKNSVRTRDAQ